MLDYRQIMRRRIWFACLFHLKIIGLAPNGTMIDKIPKNNIKITVLDHEKNEAFIFYFTVNWVNEWILGVL